MFGCCNVDYTHPCLSLATTPMLASLSHELQSQSSALYACVNRHSSVCVSLRHLSECRLTHLSPITYHLSPITHHLSVCQCVSTGGRAPAQTALSHPSASHPSASLCLPTIHFSRSGDTRPPGASCDVSCHVTCHVPPAAYTLRQLSRAF
jgi:hypothetical protein